MKINKDRLWSIQVYILLVGCFMFLAPNLKDTALWIIVGCFTIYELGYLFTKDALVSNSVEDEIC